MAEFNALPSVKESIVGLTSVNVDSLTTTKSSKNIGLLITQTLLSQKGAELDKYLNYLRQFTTRNVVLVQANQFNSSIDLLIIPNISAITSNRYRDLPAVDPQFFSFLNAGLFNSYTRENTGIIGFGYSALSLFDKLGQDLISVTGYDQEKQVAVVIDKSIKLSKIDSLNTHIYANIGDMKHSFALDSGLDVFPSYVAKKGNNTPTVTGVATSFIRRNTTNTIAGCLHNPLIKENLPSSYDCKLLGFSIGDHISNLIIKDLLNQEG